MFIAMCQLWPVVVPGVCWGRDAEVSRLLEDLMSGFEVAPFLVRNLPASAGETGDSGSIPGSGISSGGGNGNLLQYSCLGNPMDRGAWWPIVYEVAKSIIYTIH